MPTDTLKPGAGNNLLLSNDDASAKVEVKEDGTNQITGNTGIGADSSGLSAKANQLVVGSGTGDQGLTIYAGTGSSSSAFFADGTSGTDAYDGWVEYLHDQRAMSFGTAGLERMYLDENGIMVRTYQPTFYAYLTNPQTTLTDGVTLNFDEELYDVGSNFDKTTKTFTAPIAGKYVFTLRGMFYAFDSSSQQYFRLNIVTTDRYYHHIIGPDAWDSNPSYTSLAFCTTALMGASHTAYCTISWSGGSAPTQMSAGASYGEFSGYLL